MKGPPPRAKHKRPERIDLNKQEKQRGLQQRVIQPQVSCRAEVEGHQLVKQQAERPERPAVHQVVRVGLVEPSEYLLRVVL